MIVLFDDTEILIQSEDAACQQERLRHVIEQSAGDVLDANHLVGYERDTAHDEQHRTGILRDFEAFLVFHGFLLFYLFYLYTIVPPAAPSNRVMT